METGPQSRECNRRVEQRIAWMTLCVGAGAALLTALVGFPRWGAGILLGALLAWLNFSWLEQALDAVLRVATAQSGQPCPRVSIWTWVKFFSRYGLIALLLYTVWLLFRIPVVSMLAGLCALGAGVMAECVYEVIRRPA